MADYYRDDDGRQVHVPEGLEPHAERRAVRRIAAVMVLFVASGMSFLAGAGFGSGRDHLSPVGAVIDGLTRDAGRNCVVLAYDTDETSEAAAKADVQQLSDIAENFDPPGATLTEHGEAYVAIRTPSGTVYHVVAASEVCIDQEASL